MFTVRVIQHWGIGGTYLVPFYPKQFGHTTNTRLGGSRKPFFASGVDSRNKHFKCFKNFPKNWKTFKISILLKCFLISMNFNLNFRATVLMKWCKIIFVIRKIDLCARGNRSPAQSYLKKFKFWKFCKISNDCIFRLFELR